MARPLRWLCIMIGCIRGLVLMLASTWPLSGCAGAAGAAPGPMDRLVAASSGVFAVAEVGLGAPAGFVGAGVGVMPVGWATWDVSVGVTDSGVAGASMVGLSFPVTDRANLGLGSGVSIGPYSDGPDLLAFEGYDYTMVWDWVLWSNTQFQVRHALNDALLVRFNAGVTVSVAQAAPYCLSEEDCWEASLADLLPYVAGGLEYHF